MRRENIMKWNIANRNNEMTLNVKRNAMKRTQNSYELKYINLYDNREIYNVKRKKVKKTSESNLLENENEMNEMCMSIISK